MSETEDNWDNSPEAIADWIAWYRSLQPFVLTDADRKAIEQAQKEQKEWELAHFEERAEKLRRLWE